MKRAWHAAAMRWKNRKQVSAFNPLAMESMSLENAPDDVKLAVDLIVLLEENQIPARTVLRALDIVKRDYEKKLQSDEASQSE